MRDTIEDIARSVKDDLSGFDSDARIDAQTERGGKLIEQLATGGLALGGGLGALTALVNYSKSLSDEAAMEDEAVLNDDTLYIREIEKSDKKKKRTKSAAEVNRWLAPGVGLTAAVVAAGGSYALTQMVYNYMQKKRRQAQLDEAQAETLLAADMEIDKEASDKTNMTFSDLATAFPVAIPLLAALASGGVAYAALNKTFPVIKPQKSKYPKRIRQVSSDGTVEAADDEDLPERYKKASIAELNGEADLKDSANEFLMLLTSQIAIEKRASVCITNDIINCVAAGGIGDVTATLRDGGLEAVAEVVKTASQAIFEDRIAATALICKSARLAPVATYLAASEYADMVPGIFAAALSQPEEQMDKAAGVGSLLQLTMFRPSLLSKEANVELLADLAESMGAELDENGNPIDAESISDTMDSDVAGPVSGEDEGGGDSEAVADEDIDQTGGDAIDSFMEMSGESELQNELEAGEDPLEDDEEQDGRVPEEG